MASHPLDYRYGKDTRPIFDEEEWYMYNWKVEAALARTHAKMNIIEQKHADIITKAVNYAKPEKVREYENTTDHDLMAMVLSLADACIEVDNLDGKEAGGKVHLAATSYDIEDCAQVLRIKDAYKIIRTKAEKVRDTFVEMAIKYKDVPCIGRTHAQQAVPITFGFKYANYANDLQKQIDNMDYQMSRIKGKFSGAVGAYNTLTKLKTINGNTVDSQKLEDMLGAELGIEMEDISTQVVGRAPYADLMSALATTGEVIEKYALEIRELSRQEILEVREGTKKKQVGSSTMVHKKNPINSENACSLSRIIRALTIVAHENIALMHERDLTNSANERVIIYESFGFLDEILTRAEKVTKNLEVYQENIYKNLYTTNGLVMGEAVMTELAERGMGRQDAHELLRVATREAEEQKMNFIEKLKTMNSVTKLISKEELDQFKPENYTGEASSKCIEIAEKLWTLDRILGVLYKQKYPESLPSDAEGNVSFKGITYLVKEKEGKYTVRTYNESLRKETK